LSSIRRDKPNQVGCDLLIPWRTATSDRLQPLHFLFFSSTYRDDAIRRVGRYRPDCAGFCADLGAEIGHRPMEVTGHHVGVSHGHLDRAMAEDRLKGWDVARGL
jgi:hypothetical protein